MSMDSGIMPWADAPPPTPPMGQDHPILQMAQDTAKAKGSAIMNAWSENQKLGQLSQPRPTPRSPIDILQDESQGYTQQGEPIVDFWNKHGVPGQDNLFTPEQRSQMPYGTKDPGGGVISDGSGRMATREEIAAANPQAGGRMEVHAMQPAGRGGIDEVHAKQPVKGREFESSEAGVPAYDPHNAAFEHDVGAVFDVEGRFNKDTGGRTAFGISAKSNPEAWKNGRPTKEQAKEIYKNKYWDEIDADHLDPKIRLMAFDTAVNEGVGVAKRFIRQSGGDLDKFADLREGHYSFLRRHRPGKYKKYFRGWLNRLDKIYDIAKQEPQGA